MLLKAVRAVLSVKGAFERRLLPRVNPPRPAAGVTREELVGRFPRYLAGPGAGVECGEGWFALVWDLCAAIEGLEQLGMPRGTTLRAEGKLGGLFVRLATRSLVVRELARRTELRAAATCERCGAPGALRIGRGFAKTLCDHHARVRNSPAKLHPPHPAARPELIFVDTEFTDFDYPQLISIGLVSEQGERFYSELSNGWSRQNCSPFVRDRVLPQLVGGDFLQERYYAGRRLGEWLAGHGGPVRIVTDAPGYDWALMQELLRDTRPDNLIPAPVTFYSEGFPELAPLLKEARRRALRGSSPHHALKDAEALRDAWEVMVEHVHPAVLDQYLRQL